MKKLLVLSIILVTKVFSFAQHLQINWQNCILNPYAYKDIDETNIVSTNNGYILGFTRFNNVIVEDHIYDSEIWLIGVDSLCNILWEKVFNGSNPDGIINLHKVNTNKYLIYSISYSVDGDVTYNPYPNGSGNIWIIEIDSLGNKIWDIMAGGSRIEPFSLSNLITNEDGTFMSICQTCSSDGDITNSFGEWDTWITKYDSLGKIEWDYTLGTDQSDFQPTMIKTSDNSYLISMYSFAGSQGNIKCDDSLTYDYIARAILVKLSSNREIIWQNCLGESEHLVFSLGLETSDGYITAGSAYSDDGAVAGAGYHLGYSHDHQSSDIWLRKIDFDGNLIWQRCYGGTKDDWPTNIFQTSDGNLVIFGQTESYNGDVKGFHYLENPNEGNPDIWMFKVKASTGEILMSECIGTHAYEYLGFNNR